MRYSPKSVGFLQAIGVSVYIGLFAFIAFRVQHWTQTHPFLIHPIAGITLFLLAFVISAVICGSIVLIYPITLFFGGQKVDSLKVLFWNAVGLITIFILVAVISFVFFLI